MIRKLFITKSITKLTKLPKETTFWAQMTCYLFKDPGMGLRMNLPVVEGHQNFTGPFLMILVA